MLHGLFFFDVAGGWEVRVLKEKDKERISIVNRYVKVGIRPQIQKKTTTKGMVHLIGYDR